MDSNGADWDKFYSSISFKERDFLLQNSKLAETSLRSVGIRKLYTCRRLTLRWK